jgi:multimeric flavodoxin WrbA
MKAILLSAVPAGHASMTELGSVVHVELARAGYGDVRAFDLASTKLAFCQGDFDCWVKTPGRCRTQDAETDIVGALHDADALVLLGPVTFGGHGYVQKRAVDRLICLTLPFFSKRTWLTHHPPRYERPPAFFSIGWAPEPSLDIAETFAALNDANAVNLSAPGCGALVLDAAHGDAWAPAVRAMLETPRVPGSGITARQPLRDALLSAAAAAEDCSAPARIGRVALLIGSAKPKGTSISETLARSLAKRLGRAGVAAELHFATEFVHEDPRVLASAGAIAACDIFVLVTPLYVDSLPALATHALELVARSRRGPHASARFVAVVNCGFPEPEHARTALRIARHFANEAGYAWGGGLPLGGAGIVTPGAPLDEPHGPVAHVVRALDLAAAALAAGHPLPPEAIEAMASTPMPDAVYRLAGELGFRREAYRNAVAQNELRARPLDTAD